VSAATAEAAPRPTLLGKAGPLVLARLFTAGLTICIPFVLARAMTLQEFGTYKQLFLIAMTLYLLMPFGVVQSLYYFMPRAESKRPFVGQTLVYSLGAGLFAGFLLVLLTGQIGHWFQNPDMVHYRWSVGAYTAFLVASLPLEITLTSQGRTKWSAICYLGSDIIRAGAMTLPVLLGYGLAGCMWAIAALMLLRTAVTWVLLLRTTTGPLFDRKLFSEQIAYAAPFGAAMLLAVPQQYLHQYAVSVLVAPALYAIYTIGCFQLPVVDLLYTPTSEVLMVQLGELDKAGRMEEGVRAFREATARLAFFFLPMSAFLFAIAPEFIVALFGAKFSAAIPLFRISVIGVALTIFPMDGVLRARHQTRHIFIAYLVKALVTIPLVYFGATRFGMIGAITSYAITEVIGKSVLMIRVPAALSTPEHPLTLKDVIPGIEIGRSVVAAAVGCVAVWLLRMVGAGYLPHMPVGFVFRVIPLLIAGVVFSVAYLAVLHAAGVRPFAFLIRPRRQVALTGT
jgi:O-antigen/teichoic acid export membrane protein